MSQWLQTVQGVLPDRLRSQLNDLPPETIHLLDTILQFSLGGECPDDASDDTRQHWISQQQHFQLEISRLRSALPNGKRPRDTVEATEPGPESKKPKLNEDDIHSFTLHSLSVTSPLRKKLDIAIHQETLKLLNPSTQAVELSVSLSDLKRVFLIPTRGKAKPHWTVIILASDTQSPPPAKSKGKATAQPAPDSEEVQIVFGVDAVPTVPYSTSDDKHAKGTPILPSLRAFLSHLPPHIVILDLDKEFELDRAKGVQAYRRAKEGTLWFLSGGVLWDGKPCEFWDVENLVGQGKTGELESNAGTGTDGVRIVSATGRTCSVFLRRLVPALKKGEPSAQESGDEDDDDDEHDRLEVEETDFNMIDGKEQDAILQWIKRHKRQFGIPKVSVPASASNGQTADATEAGSAKVDVKGKGKAVAPPPPDEDSEDEEDEDFVAESDSDGGSATSSSDEDSDASGGEASDADEDMEDEDEDGSGEEEETLDPARHPLMRPGAMPKMSKAAMDAAVKMMTEDLVGGATNHGKHAAESRSVMDVDEDDEEEQDELDD